MNEEGGSTGSTKDAGPQRKKRALAKPSKPTKAKTVNKIKGKLSAILSLPIEVFVEIMGHLALPDVLSLSRANKFFRQLLMTRSATASAIWRSAVGNVPGLPPCPEDLCEPQYAALIYTKYCSMCGVKIAKDMDPYLNVRICKECIETHVISVDEVEPDFQHFIPCSKITRTKTGRYDVEQCLTRDVEKMQQWFDGLTTDDDEELEAAFDERIREMQARIKYAKQMEVFLRHMAKMRTKEINQLKEQRRWDIKRRLEDAGWEERDWIFPEQVARKWASLVEAPQALTDRAWQKLYPSMVPYLEQNQRWHTRRSKLVRKGRRLRRMRRLLVGIRNKNYLFDTDDDSEDEVEDGTGDGSAELVIDQSTENGSSSEDGFSSDAEDDFDGDTAQAAPLTSNTPCNKVKAPFPPMVDLLKWPIISNLLETDTDADTMQEEFEELREEIEEEIRCWGSAVEEELVEILKAGSADDIELNAIPSLQLQTEGAPMSHLTPTTRLLLRADSVFRVSEDSPLVAPMPLYFPEVFPALQARSDAYCTSDFKRLRENKRPKHGYTWNPSEVEYYPEGSAAAKALLKQLGRVNAAQFELQALGAKFTCGSCGDNRPRMWNEMVQHYAEAIIHANMATKAKPSVKKQVKYVNTHSLGLKAKRKPLLVLHGEDEVKALLSKRRRYETLVRCKLCEQLGIDFESPRDIMLKHVRAVHTIKPPKAEHYERTYNVRKNARFYDRTGDVSDSTEATDQEFVRSIMSSYVSYGPRVFWSDYGRHAEAYDDCVWYSFFDEGMY